MWSGHMVLGWMTVLVQVCTILVFNQLVTLIQPGHASGRGNMSTSDTWGVLASFCCLTSVRPMATENSDQCRPMTPDLFIFLFVFSNLA